MTTTTRAGALASLPISYEGQPEEERTKIQELQRIQQELRGALQNRQQLFDPVLLAMAQGFLAPTKTGSFGESIANAAALVGPAQASAEKQRLERIAMERELAAADLATSQETRKRALLGKLYAQPKPGEDYAINPEAALELARLTGDTSIFEKLNAQQRQQRQQQLGRQLFTEVEVPGEEGAPAKTEVKFNPSAAMKVVQSSDNPMKALDDYLKMVPQLRKSGMLSDLKGDESTPFDAMIMMADSIGDQGPAIKQQAQRLANQYKRGLIDEDKANALSQQMLNMTTGLMDKQQARAFQETMRVLSYNLAQGTQAIARGQLQVAQENAQERADARRREQESKLTDQQKIDYRQNVVPIVQEGVKADSALMQVTALKDIINKAPSGVVSGAGAKTIGALFGTDENTALRKLEGLSKGLITMIPRLPGAQSNLDAQNLEKSIMRLQDITLTNKQRLDLVNEIESGFKRLANRAANVQSQWEATKKFDMKALSQPAQEAQRPIPTASDITYGKQPAYREAFKSKFGKYPEEF